MKPWLFAFMSLLLAWAPLRAQVPAPGFGSMPLDIVNADNTYFENGVAYAEGNVILQYGATTIYADYAQYHADENDPLWHEALVIGHVRIYQEGQVFVGERAVYNLQTKTLHASNFEGDMYPFRFSADSLSTLSKGAYIVKDATFTTSDSSMPDYHLGAKSARIYPGQRVIMRDVTLYLGNVPVFWWPYLYQALRRDMSYTVHPGMYTGWGFFTLTEWNFPIADNWDARLYADFRDERGLATGLDSTYRWGENGKNWGRFRSYFADDIAPETIDVGPNKDKLGSDRYRVSVQDRVYITDDLWASVDINKISDVRMLRDFLINEYRIDPQPDNDVSLTQWDKYYTVSAVYRKQINDFNDVTERLPEIALDVTRHAVTEGSNLFYDGETSYARLSRNYSSAELATPAPTSVTITATGQSLNASAPTAVENYAYNRFDTYHEVLYPMRFWNFLSFVPRLGLRGDYYSKTGAYGIDTEGVSVEDLLPNTTVRVKNFDVTNSLTTPVSASGDVTFPKLYTQGGVARGVIDGGFESSFKISRDYPNVESRDWGLDDLRHVIQPYMDLSLAATSVDPSRILQIDRFQPSTQLPMFDFPQFTSIDTISNWAVLQLGLRNRLETKRDNRTAGWFSTNTFVDVNLKEPTLVGPTPTSGNLRQGIVSNLYNRFSFSPVPWASLSFTSQTPLNRHGFNYVNSDLSFLVSKDFRLNLSNDYLDHDPNFQSQNLVDLGFYYRINDNWSIQTRDEYQFTNNTIQNQVYEIHRDLSSWIASVGFQVEDNGPGSSQRLLYAILFTMTLKDIPSATIPFSYDPDSVAGKNP